MNTTDSAQPGAGQAPTPEQADALVDALSSLRGRRGPGGRRWPGGPGGWGGPEGPGGWGGKGGPGGWRGQGEWDGGLRPGTSQDPRETRSSGEHEHEHEREREHEHEHGARRPDFGGDRRWPGHGAGSPRGHRERAGGPALLRLLGALAHAEEPLSISELAERIGVDQPRASRLVQQAVELGHAVREADPGDARRTRVRLTDTGEHLVHGVRDRQRHDATSALAALAPDERTELLRLMAKLAQAWPHE
ncbi:MarR family winged helix-turn-helix transcriptional regulator [Leucobacter komagatae]|uniref:MarR family winged helix-turn-helix transcriptional regulator n=1 Tax=Leucobacter komagatae TaxID=55969 RepID=UPI0018DCB38B|nr:MarR family winged helix-turn-helix transcriptional regulator [Leucobacter komagatae]